MKKTICRKKWKWIGPYSYGCQKAVESGKLSNAMHRAKTRKLRNIWKKSICEKTKEKKKTWNEL